MAELIQFQNTVKAHIKQSTIINDVVKTLSELPDFTTKLKLDPENREKLLRVIDIKAL